MAHSTSSAFEVLTPISGGGVFKGAAIGSKSGRKQAVVAVARKLAVLLHRLWVTGEVYEPLRISADAA
jgi:hypothetical protein